MKGILGRKIGMTQVFTENGEAKAVTVVEAGPCPVVRHKVEERDGYRAVQVAFGDAKRTNKPDKGHYVAAGMAPKRYLREFRLDADEESPEGEIRVEMFQAGERVHVSGTSRGKGFQGGVRRHGFGRGPMTHGSKYHRGPGSLGSRTSGGGGRVYKGRKLPGHMGAVRVTVRNLQVVRVDGERNLLLLGGAVPGAKGALLLIRKTDRGGR